MSKKLSRTAFAAAWSAGLACILALLMSSPVTAQTGPELLDFDPAQNAVGVPLGATVVLSYSAPIQATSVTSHTVAVHGMMGGLITETHSVAGEVVTITPNRQFFPGELVYTIATTDTTDITGTHPIASTQWQFTAGAIEPRCVSRFVDIEAGLFGASSSDAAWGDYDGDGDLDFVEAGVNSDNVVATKIYRNDGNGVFVDIGASLPNVSVSSLAWGDYDNDGDLDLLLFGTDSTMVTVGGLYRNDGGGTFSDTGISLPQIEYPSVAWGDYDNDGYLDIAFYGENGTIPHCSLHHNNGDGTFSQNASAGLPDIFLTALAWGDYDNDGFLDLAISGYELGIPNTLTNTLYHNNGDGTFSANSSSGLMDLQIISFAWGDYDRDGYLDLAVTGWGGGSQRYSRVYHNNGDGTFTDVDAGLTDIAGYIEWGDYDNDGYLDLALAGRIATLSRAAQIYHNNGDGTFTRFEAGLLESSDGVLRWGDYDNDGDLDLLRTGRTNGDPYTRESIIYRNDDCLNVMATNPVTNALNVALNTDIAVTFDADPQASTIHTDTFVVHGMLGGLITGTFGIDGHTATLDTHRDLFPGEVVRTSLTTGIEGTGAGLAAPHQWEFTGTAPEGWGYFDDTPVDFGTGNDETYALAWADWDGDGDLDLAVGNAGGQNVIYPNGGDGSFDAGVNFGSGADSTYALAWGDFDRDGDLDLAVGNSGQSAVYPNNGGSFGSAVNFGGSGDKAYALAWCDFDGDGDLDLAVGNYGGQNAVYPNNGDGTFGNAIHVGTGFDLTQSVAWGDYDNDGDFDLAAGNYLQNSVYVNNGDGAFGSTVNVGSNGDVTYSIAWGDFNGDGNLDLVAGNYGGQDAIYPGNGDGTFGSAVDLGDSGNTARAVAAGDFDADGDLDIAVGNEDSQNRVYINNGDGTFGGPVQFGTGSDRTRAVTWGDFDGDGDLDLAAGNSGQQNQIYLNEPLYGIAVEKTPASDTIPAGYTLQYTIVVSNTSDLDLPDATVTDTLPAGTLYHAAVPGGIWNSVDKTVVWHLGSIPLNGSETIQLYLHPLTNLTPGTVLTNVVDVHSSVGVSDTVTAAGVTVVEAPATPTPTATATSTQWPTMTGTPTATSTPTTTPAATATSTGMWTATPTATDAGPTPTPTTTATTGAIDGCVWVDQDANGEIGSEEVGLAGATVKLLDSASIVKETWVTGANGSYAFTGLAAGAYTVQVELPEDYFATTPDTVTLDVAIGAVETVNFGAVLIGEGTPTPTMTVQPDLVIDGYISASNPLFSTNSPVFGANVSASACGAPAVETTTAEDGYYNLTLPASDLAGCDTVTMEVRAIGFAPWAQDYPVDELIINPRIDVNLSRAAGLWNWLPLVMK